MEGFAEALLKELTCVVLRLHVWKGVGPISYIVSVLLYLNNTVRDTCAIAGDGVGRLTAVF